MNKYHYFIIAVVIIGFYGCKKGAKDPKPAANDNVSGKWYPVRKAFKLYRGSEEYENTVDTTFNTEDYIQFNSDGMGYANSHRVTAPVLSGNFEYTVTGHVLVFTKPGFNITSYPGPGTTFHILKLTSQSLELRSDTLVTQVGADQNKTIEDDTYSSTQ